MEVQNEKVENEKKKKKNHGANIGVLLHRKQQKLLTSLPVSSKV